jgi:hypothetical protein
VRATRLGADLAPLDAPAKVMASRSAHAEHMPVRLSAQPGSVLVTFSGASPEGLTGRALHGPTGALLDTEPGLIAEFPLGQAWYTSYWGAVAPLTGTANEHLAVFDQRSFHPDETPANRSANGVWTRRIGFGQAPQTTLTGAPVNGHWRANGSATFTASAAATFECDVVEVPEANRSRWNACASPWAFSDLRPHTLYEVRVRATAAGWADGTPAARAFRTDDFDPPVVEYTWGPPRMTTSRRARFAFVADEPQVSFECRLDDAAPFPCPSGEVQLEDLPLGRHTFSVAAADQVGRGPAACTSGRCSPSGTRRSASAPAPRRRTRRPRSRCPRRAGRAPPRPGRRRPEHAHRGPALLGALEGARCVRARRLAARRTAARRRAANALRIAAAKRVVR